MKKTFVVTSALFASLTIAGMAFVQTRQSDSNRPATPAVPATKATPATPADPASGGNPATPAVPAAKATPATPAVPANSAKMQTSASASVVHAAAHSKPAAMASHTLSGKIVSVNAVANTIVIRTKQGEQTLNVAPVAKISVGKENRLADLKTGSSVKVSYKMEGRERVATRIW